MIISNEVSMTITGKVQKHALRREGETYYIYLVERIKKYINVSKKFYNKHNKTIRKGDSYDKKLEK